MGDVVSMAEKAQDGKLWTVGDALKDALKDYESGETRLAQANKVVIIGLIDEPDGEYDVTYTQAGMKASEIISLLEIMKVYFVHEMGY